MSMQTEKEIADIRKTVSEINKLIKSQNRTFRDIALGLKGMAGAVDELGKKLDQSVKELNAYERSSKSPESLRDKRD